MKLLNKTILYYVLVSLPLLVIAVFFSYALISTELRDGTDENLMKEAQNAERIARTDTTIGNVRLSFDGLSTIGRVGKITSGHFYSDTLIYDRSEGEYVKYRMLKSFFSFDNRSYQVTVMRTRLEEQELVEGLLSAFALIIGFLVLSFFIVNWLISKTLWRPFYKTLDSLNTYELKNHEHHHLSLVNIKEFNQLNQAIDKMTEKIYTDFVQQKEFTENASHEMQTPLAVIKANLSLLMQSPNLREDEMNQLQSIENTIKKMTSLNKALILLLKIENNQFKENEPINIKNVVVKNLGTFADLLQAKRIQLDFYPKEDLFVTINSVLADILITNLLQNAIRHNKEGGRIKIGLFGNSLTIANSGEPLSIPADALFVRFKKNDASKDSLGLGLSIVKSICQHHHFMINYSYQNQLHTFTLTF